MKKKSLTISLSILVLTLGLLSIIPINDTVTDRLEQSEIKVLHRKHLDNSPYKANRHLSKSERKALGLPPNGFYEQEWELTMDPKLGYPTPERTFEVQMRLRRTDRR